jgi:dipeptidase/GNAT superfamily N-acetyltransferase
MKELRRATADDKPRILEISAQIWKGEDYIPGVIDRWLTDETGEVVVALADGVLTGFARHSCLLPGFVWFEGIRTDPTRQNRGVGRAIARYQLDWAARMGARRIGLSTHRSYRQPFPRSGFRKVSPGMEVSMVGLVLLFPIWYTSWCDRTVIGGLFSSTSARRCAMCDTMVALGNVTADGVTLFAKNSDREPNEAQYLVQYARTRHPSGSTVKCTHIEIPQVEETYAVLLSRPFWIWGAEMGTNEFGVTIGNETVFSKVPPSKEPGLIGMDLLRLALERASSARVALDVIVELLGTYGQGGNCGHRHQFFYHNSFLIADPQEAWVLETVDRLWVAERVRDIRTISNNLSIGSEWDLVADDLVPSAVKHGWCRGRDDFHFARSHSDTIYTRFAAGRERRQCSTDLLSAEQGRITVQTMMRALRDHGPQAQNDPRWRPGGITNPTICAHANWGPIRGYQSTGSLISQLTPGRPVHWVTGTSAPCTGVFKPVFFDVGVPDIGPAPTDQYDPTTLWWSHERLHRAVLEDYAARLPAYRQERDDLEACFLDMVASAGEAERATLSARCFQIAREATDRWLARVRATPVRRRPGFLSRRAWAQWNRAAGFPAEGG